MEVVAVMVNLTERDGNIVIVVVIVVESTV